MNRLEEIESRVKAATPGPWERNEWYGGGDCDCGLWYDTEPDSVSHAHGTDIHGHPPDCAQCEKNEQLVLHAAEYIESLLAVVHALANCFVCPLCDQPVMVRGIYHAPECPLAPLLEEVSEG